MTRQTENPYEHKETMEEFIDFLDEMGEGFSCVLEMSMALLGYFKFGDERRDRLVEVCEKYGYQFFQDGGYIKHSNGVDVFMTTKWAVEHIIFNSGMTTTSEPFAVQGIAESTMVERDSSDIYIDVFDTEAEAKTFIENECSE